MVICLEPGADAYGPADATATGFTFLVPAHPGSPGQGAIKRVCVSLMR